MSGLKGKSSVVRDGGRGRTPMNLDVGAWGKQGKGAGGRIVWSRKGGFHWSSLSVFQYS